MAAKIPTTVASKYIHAIQPTVTKVDDIDFTIASDSQLEVVESMEFNQDVIVEGDLWVRSATAHPTSHTLLPGRSEPDQHPASSISVTPAQELTSINVQSALLELDKERCYRNSGCLVLPAITKNGDGTVVVADNGEFALASSMDTASPVNRYKVAGGLFNPVNNSLNYIYVSYNNGLPVMLITTNRDDVANCKLITCIPVYTLYREGNNVDIIDWDTLGISMPEKMFAREFDTSGRFQRSLSKGGVNIEDAGALRFKVTSGRIWTVARDVDVLLVDSAIDTVFLHWKDALGVWQKSTVTTYNNTQYQSPTGLALLSPSKFAVNWIWRRINNTKTADIVLGAGNYKLIEAQSSPMPTPPPEVTTFGFLSGRIIIEQAATTPTQIDQSGDVAFSMAAATVHNDLTGRDASDAHPATSITNTPYGTITSTTTQGAINEHEDDLAALRLVGVDTGIANGFVSRTDSTITLSSLTVSIAPTSTSFAYYYKNAKVIKTGGATCATTIPNTIGTHFIYFDANGQLQNSMTPWAYDGSVVFVAIVYLGYAGGSVYDERHGSGRDIKLHETLHYTRGAAYRSGFAQTYPSTASDGIMQIESGIFYDEDIKHSISQQKIARLWYQFAGGIWSWVNGTDNGGYDRPYIWNASTSRVRYPKSDNSYTLTDAGPSELVCIWAYATNDKDRPITLVTQARTAAHNTLALARAESQPDSLPMLPEAKLLYRWIYRGDGEYQEAADYRTVSPLPGGGSTTVVHNNTTGIQGGSPGEYYHLTQAQHDALIASAQPYLKLMSAIWLNS